MKQTTKQDGQGLVEYALILVLVAVVVMAILTVLGPQVGNVFSRVVSGLGGVPTNNNGGGGGGNGNPSEATVTAVKAWRADGTSDVVVIVSVSASTNVTVEDSQSGKSTSVSCNPDCTVTLPAVGPDPGSVTATADGGSSMTASYPAQN